MYKSTRTFSACINEGVVKCELHSSEEVYCSTFGKMWFCQFVHVAHEKQADRQLLLIKSHSLESFRPSVLTSIKQEIPDDGNVSSESSSYEHQH